MGEITGLDVFSPTGATVVALLSLRVAGVIWTAPVFSARTLSTKIKAGITVLLVIMLWPAAMTAAVVPVMSVGTVLSEIVLGMSMGLGAAIFVGAAEAAGDMLAVQMGLSGANVLDPMTQTQLPVLGQLLSLFVTTLLLSLGGHLVILQALTSSLELIPTGTTVEIEGLLTVVGLGSNLLWLGLRMAAPVVVAMVLANVALGVLARTVPQLNVLMVAFPVQIAVGLFVLAGTLPLIASGFSGWEGDYTSLVSGMFESLAPSPGGR